MESFTVSLLCKTIISHRNCKPLTWLGLIVASVINRVLFPPPTNSSAPVEETTVPIETEMPETTIPIETEMPLSHEQLDKGADYTEAPANAMDTEVFRTEPPEEKVPPEDTDSTTGINSAVSGATAFNILSALALASTVPFFLMA